MTNQINTSRSVIVPDAEETPISVRVLTTYGDLNGITIEGAADSEGGFTLADVLRAAVGQVTDKVAVYDVREDGAVVVTGDVILVRQGEGSRKVADVNAEQAQNGDSIIVDRKHTNG